ncbi:MAG: UDP-N-acetylmuramate dehydrogenase [Oscillospiraceae bacterium]|nr:UDP-N-acetylmuramate dehydrogenase [Oscillospiraceae bacterium]
MNPNILSDIITLSEKLGCCTLVNEPLSKHTTFKVGGYCPLAVFASSDESIKSIIKYCTTNGVKLLVIGNGSNLLVSDKGFDGVVLIIGKDYQSLTLVDDTTIEVKSGCLLSQLCMFALQNELTGLEFAYGIPGTVGGAVYMNAGAYDGEISNVIESAQAIDSDSNVVTFTREQMELGYRKSIFQDIDCVITKAVFKLKKGDKAEIKAKMDDLMNRRKSKQPLEYPSAGSTFKRPLGNFAGKLIDDCGLRGYTVGGAQVSEKHCGFVINKNNATFEDITTLIRNVQNIVFEKTGYCLECEVKIID